MGLGRIVDNSSTKRFEVALVDGQIASAIQMYVTEVRKQNWPLVRQMEEAMSKAADAVDEGRRYAKLYQAARLDERECVRASDREKNAALIRMLEGSGKLTWAQMGMARWKVDLLLELAQVTGENGARTKEQARLVRNLERASVNEDIKAIVAHMPNTSGKKSLMQGLMDDAKEKVDMFAAAMQRKIIEDELDRTFLGSGSVHVFLLPETTGEPSESHEDGDATSKKDPDEKSDPGRDKSDEHKHRPDFDFDDIKRD